MGTAIQEEFHNKMKKPNLWICAFALMQGNPEDIATQLGTDETALDQSPFVRALKEADTYLIVRNRKRDLCSRIWCIAEFMFAKKHGFIPNKTLVTGPDTFAGVTTTCLDAGSFDPDDKAKILKELLTEHSYKQIDKYMNQFREFGTLGSTASKKTSTGVETILAPKEAKLSISERMDRISIELEIKFEEGSSSKSDKLDAMEMDCFSEKQSGNIMCRIRKLEKELELV